MIATLYVSSAWFQEHVNDEYSDESNAFGAFLREQVNIIIFDRLPQHIQQSLSDKFKEFPVVQLSHVDANLTRRMYGGDFDTWIHNMRKSPPKRYTPDEIDEFN
jgi:hypothetical protein